MPAEVLFAGGRRDSVSITGTVNENGSFFDSAYAECSLLPGYAETSFFSCTAVDANGAATSVVSGETFWFHFEVSMEIDFIAANTNLIVLRDSANNPWVALRAITGNTLGLYYNSGTGDTPTWTRLGTGSFTRVNGLRSHDIRVQLGATHTAEWFVSNSSLASGNFTQAGLTNLRRADCTGIAIPYYSQLMITRDVSTVGAKVRYRSASGTGTANAWTGSHTDINETTLNDSTLMSSATADQVFTFNYLDIAAVSGLSIAAVFVGSRVRNDGTSPVNFQAAIRSAGNNYFSPNAPGVGLSFTPSLARFDTDPATSALWTVAGFNAAEIGGKSIA